MRLPLAVSHCARGLLTVLAVALSAAPASAQDDPDTTCPDGGYDPTPTAVAVEAVPIVVESTTAQYFVLYVRHDLNADTTVEAPVLVKKGAAGMTTLAENVAALPIERYRVEKYLVTDPADVDGDCIDDLTELGNPAGMNPVNAAAAVPLSDGAVAIPDRNTFETLAEAGRYVKFLVLGLYSGSPRIYFINANTHTYHRGFQQALTALGIEEKSADDSYNGLLTYHPELQSADGSPGLYSIWSYRIEPFAVNDLLYTLFAANMPLLDDNFAFHLREQLRLAYNDVPLYEASRIRLLLDKDVAPESDFIPMNKAEGYGLLRTMDLEDSPNPRDVVIYQALPNELSRVAGIITTVAQTPLSHVNLRAVQDGVPNAFIRGALDKPDINALIGHYVQYTVTADGYTIRAATKPEVDSHYASSRPTTVQTPRRDLSVTEITPLSGIGFGDSDAFGVKAANVAVLRTLGFPEGTVPDGFAIPFYFYDEFMQHNNFYARIETMLADPDFQSNFDTQEDELKDLRDDIEDADTPAWIVTALATMNESFPDGINRRYRSSTNNEDLPGFSGAGLYDSKSQKPSEDEDDLAKSLKEVYASLWNFRAFIERDFHRIDHLAAAMGILVHPSYQDEKVNGVAVSFDLIAGRRDYYYANSQVGEDLVTNPDALSTAEEVLLDIYGSAILLGASNQVAPGQRLMSNNQYLLLHDHLFVIHHHFKNLYAPESDEPFAMEIEFKITSDNVLAIKQARPWVFNDASPPPLPSPQSPPPPPLQPPPPTGGGSGSGSGGGGGGGGGGGAANRPPVVESEIGDQTLDSGDVLELDIRLNFYDRDQRALDYTVQSADPSVAEVEVDRNGLVTIRGIRRGVTAITVTAADRRDERASQTFVVTVGGPALVALVPRAANLVREGFVRVINHSAQAGEIAIEAIDDTGTAVGPVVLALDANETVHFNSMDLEDGNAAKGLADGVGPGTGDWRLVLDSDLDFEVLSYIRTDDGVLTAMHDTVPLRDGTHQVAIFNPGSNPNQVSHLRLINPGEMIARVTVAGIDDAGATPGSTVGFDVPAGESVTLTGSALELGAGLEGALGDGTGKWRLSVNSDRPIVAMSLLSSPTGHLTNLSALPRAPEEEGGRIVPLFPSASDPLGREGFVRVANRADESGTVSIEAYDDSNLTYPTVALALNARQTRHFNSDDLELGNAAKGLTGSTGTGMGDWRLLLSSDLDIDVLAYIRTEDGFLTSMHDVAPELLGEWRVAIFNPGSNPNQVSGLRLVNTGEAVATVTITGVDDAGASPGSAVVVTVPAGASRTIPAAELESGGEGLAGALGDGEGKWRLLVDSDQPIVVMSLLSSPTGHLTNLSTAPDGGGA